MPESAEELPNEIAEAKRIWGTSDGPVLEYYFGEARIVFVAHHAIRYSQDLQGKVLPMKMGDPGTAEIAIMSARRLGGACLVQAQAVSTYGIMKERLMTFAAHYFRLVDIHGMKADYGSDVCIGRGEFPSDTHDGPIRKLSEFLAPRGFLIGVDSPFDGRGNGPLATYFQRIGGWAMQLEFSPRLRSTEGLKITVEALEKAFE